MIAAGPFSTCQPVSNQEASPRIGDADKWNSFEAWAKTSFQSIGVTKDWRLGSLAFEQMTTTTFPINRRHQGLATTLASPSFLVSRSSFQSIGVTKDWRLGVYLLGSLYRRVLFPINRRHQGLATAHSSGFSSGQIAFPINRRHQGLATPDQLYPGVKVANWFPINRRHQGLATRTAS